ncbi:MULTISPECIES: hypothetical protein [Streptomyces]|uniref:Uncharacterized protein n=2 Tax=Streptomyces TaxID=1883 RepID=A0ABV9J5N4_9ACTN
MESRHLIPIEQLTRAFEILLGRPPSSFEVVAQLNDLVAGPRPS